MSHTLVCCLGSDTCLHSLEASPKVYTQFYRITFLCSLYSTMSSTFSGFPKPRAFVSLHCYMFPMIFSQYWACFQAQAMIRLREKKMQWDFFPRPLDLSSSGWEFGVHSAVAAIIITAASGLPGIGMRVE